MDLRPSFQEMGEDRCYNSPPQTVKGIIVAKLEALRPQ